MTVSQTRTDPGTDIALIIIIIVVVIVFVVVIIIIIIIIVIIDGFIFKLYLMLFYECNFIMCRSLVGIFYG